MRPPAFHLTPRTVYDRLWQSAAMDRVFYIGRHDDGYAVGLCRCAAAVHLDGGTWSHAHHAEYKSATVCWKGRAVGRHDHGRGRTRYGPDATSEESSPGPG